MKPVVVLVCWTMVLWAWMIIVRIPALKAAGIDLNNLVGGKGTDADKILPAKAQWPSHNYNHLLEQPTIFYAVAIVLALIGAGGGIDAAIAWAYVVLRIGHSIVQATFNRVLYRFLLFLLSSLCLAALAVHAAIAVFGFHAHG